MATKDTTGKPDTNQAPNLGGRPRFLVDYEVLKVLVGMQCTREECALVLKCDPDTLTNALQRDYEEAVAANPDIEPWDFAPGFRAYFERFRAFGRASLRQAQFKAAISDRNPTMLKWLGINMLDQTDRIDHVSHDHSMSPAGLDHFYGKGRAAPAPGTDGDSERDDTSGHG